MKTLVLLAVISACVADSNLGLSSYTSYSENFDLQPEHAITFTQPKPRSTRRSSFSSRKSTFFPQEEFFTVPVRIVSPSSRSFFSSPKTTFSSSSLSLPSPQPASSAPRPTYSVPKPTYSAPKPTYSAPKSTYSAPRPTYAAPQNSYYGKPVVPILRDDRRHPEGGAYSFAVETGDGIRRQETGIPVYSKEGPVTAVKGSYSYTLPDGQVFELHYIADENGFQPQSSYIPVAPAFPHPIPAHALEQIERGRREHEARARADRLRQSYSAPSGSRPLSTSYNVPF